MLLNRNADNVRSEHFRVSPEDRPGWVWGTTRLPKEGEEVFCAAGAGTVAAVRGKTGNGSRLVEIKLTAPAKGTIFAAASNVLLPPTVATEAEDVQTMRGSDQPDSWLAGSGEAELLR